MQRSNIAYPKYHDVVLEHRLATALKRLNPTLPEEALDEARRRVLRIEGSFPADRDNIEPNLLKEGFGVDGKEQAAEKEIGRQFRIRVVAR